MRKEKAKKIDEVSASDLKAYRRKKQFTSAILSGGIAAVASPVMTMAAGPSAGGGGSSTDTTSLGDADNLMKNVVNIILILAKYGGIALLVWGIYQVVISFVNDNPQSRIQGVSLAIVGVILISLRPVLSQFNAISEYIPS